ncbi:MAG: TlpA family protein disulfide reductase [Nitrospirales bacterium]
MDNLNLSDIAVETWVQGGPISLERLIGSVVLVEVFQVNCPGCFLYALPKAIQLHEQYQDKGLIIIGVATAFEDYDKNTIKHLQQLVQTGEVIGETRKALTRQGLLTDDKLEWRLPFAIGMDRITPNTEPITSEKVLQVATKALPNLEELSEDNRQRVLNQVRSYLKQKTMKAETFEKFSLQGTPSAILFDRNGSLRDVSFGQMEHQKSLVEHYLGQLA